MSARFLNPRVEVEPEERKARVSFRLESRSQASGGELYLGWQLFDPDTGLFIREGEWQPMGLEGDHTVEVELPPERGHYHVYISPLEKRTGWHYRKGSPFLLLHATVEQGRAEVERVEATTLGSLRWANRLRSVHKAFTYPVRTGWENRGLIRSMVRRDVAARYRGSFGDVLWTILNPLLLMVTYYFVFGIVLRARFGGDPSRTGFALYFLAGMMPWLPFSEAVGRAPAVVLEHRNFVKKLLFPIEILPVNLTVSGLVTQGFALGMFLVFILVTRGGIHGTVLWLPLLIVPQMLLTLGLAWFLAALGAYVRDLGQVMGYLLTLWFFLTPICYPEDSLPADFVPVLQTNPMFVLVRGFRDVMLDGRSPDFGPLAVLWVGSAVVCILGHAWFYKLRKSFADVI